MSPQLHSTYPPKERRAVGRKHTKESEALYHQLIEQAGEGIFTVDLKGVILYANRAVRDIVKMPVPQVIGTHFQRYLDSESISRANELFKKVRTKGVWAIRDELRIIDSQKNIVPIEFTVSPIYSCGKIVQFYTIVRDVTHRKKIEQLLLEKEKLDFIQSFIAGTAQEIQHPVKGLYERCEALVNQYKDRDFEYIGFKEFKAIMNTLQVMRDQAKNCFDTTNRLLMVTKKKVGIKNASCQVNEVVRHTSKMVQSQLNTGEIMLEMKLSSQLPLTSLSSIELTQVLVNILTNAIQSIVGKGSIVIKTSLMKAEQMIRIDCLDNGTGISKENLPHVFEPFFTTRQRGPEKSTGLGLSIVYAIVKFYKGDVIITSNLRHGTHVKIFLPAYKKAAKKE